MLASSQLIYVGLYVYKYIGIRIFVCVCSLYIFVFNFIGIQGTSYFIAKLHRVPVADNASCPLDRVSSVTNTRLRRQKYLSLETSKMS